MSREALQMALEALNRAKPACFADTTITAIDDAITALRQALVDADDTSQKRVDETAKREHDPVAFRNKETGEFCTGGFMRKEWSRWTPLYTAPPKREWFGLTDGEIDILSCETVKGNKSVNWLCKVLETRLKEKNT